MTLPFADARTLADSARACALELGKALSIAVVDYGGFVVLVERMDGARPMTPSIALSKAYSAAVMQRPTAMLENWRNSDPVFFTQVGRMGQHPIVATKGGYTLKRDGVILGGLGISGGSPDEDQKICEDVLRAAGFDLDFPEWAGAAPALTRRRQRWLTTSDITSTTTGAWYGRPSCSPPARAGFAARPWPPPRTRPSPPSPTRCAWLTLSACCDGQFRRSCFESVVYDHVSGFAWPDGPAPLAGLAGIAAARRRAIPDAGALAAAGRLAQAEAAPVLATVDRSVFVTLPSPGYLAAAGSALADASAIDAVRAAGAALAAILRDEIAAPRRGRRALRGAGEPAVRAAADGGRAIGRRGSRDRRAGRPGRADRGRPRGLRGP